MFMNLTTGAVNWGDQQPGEVEVDSVRPTPLHKLESGIWILDIELVRAERDRLLREAQFIISPLQDAVDLDSASEIEVALLRQLKQYRVALIRLEQQTGFPISVEWPAVPQ